MSYVDLSDQGQVESLMPTALSVAKLYGFVEPAIESVNHGFNTTFSVSEGNRRVAIRLNTNSKKTSEEVEAEVQWLLALKEDSEILAPIPVAAVDGNYVTVGAHEELGEMLAIACQWLPGDEIGSSPSAEQLKAIGGITAKLHIFSDSWAPKAPAFLPRVSTTLMNSSNNLALLDSELATAECLELIEQCFEISEKVHQDLAERFALKPIHTDLHSYNFMQDEDLIHVIDFDDAGIGMEPQDLANTLYYLRRNRDSDQYLFEGYQQIRELPRFSKGELETLMIAREILLLNDLLTMTTAEDIAEIPASIRNTELRMRHFLATGEFSMITAD